MRIGTLARKTGLSIHTLRFYETIGVIDGRLVSRSSNNYRHYDDKAVEHLRLVRFGRDAGFTLSEITRFIEDIAHAKRRRHEVLDAKLKELQARKRSIDAICGLLRAKIARLKRADRAGAR
jgi:DNA-binding transcriptional MerR regulator